MFSIAPLVFNTAHLSVKFSLEITCRLILLNISPTDSQNGSQKDRTNNSQSFARG